MKTEDIDFNNNQILVMGKGAKKREVMFQKTTKQYLQRYIVYRGKPDNDFLWISDIGNTA